MKRLLILSSLIVFCASGMSYAAQTSLESGKHLLSQGEFVQAYSHFYQLFQNDPQNQDLNFYLGKSAYGMGDYEAAVMAFERVLIIDPDSVAAKVELGKSYQRLGSVDAAMQYFEDVLDEELAAEVEEEVRELVKEIRGEE